jgi:hypothetical protein
MHVTFRAGKFSVSRHLLRFCCGGITPFGATAKDAQHSHPVRIVETGGTTRIKRETAPNLANRRFLPDNSRIQRDALFVTGRVSDAGPICREVGMSALR